jgi:hypothetical protein
MNHLVSVLRRYGAARMGASVDETVPQSIQIDALQRDLGSVVAKSDRFLWIWLITLVLIFALDCSLVFRGIEHPKWIGAIFASTGVGLTVVLAQMRRLWHEKFATETLIALLPALGANEIKNVVMQLLSVLMKS